MCNCPAVSDEPIITAVDENWIARGGVIVTHLRFNRVTRSFFERSHGVALYHSPQEANDAARRWFLSRQEMAARVAV